MREQRNIVVCDGCSTEEAMTGIELPTGWQAFRDPRIDQSSYVAVVTFDEDYCANSWFRERIERAFTATAPGPNAGLSEAEVDAKGDREPALNAVGEEIPF